MVNLRDQIIMENVPFLYKCTHLYVTVTLLYSHSWILKKASLLYYYRITSITFDNNCSLQCFVKTPVAFCLSLDHK